MKILRLLGISLLAFCLSMGAHAQQRFFTLSGGNQGDTANAKHESQISELGSRADARDNCSSLGMVYGEGGNGLRHSKTDSRGCITSLKLENDGTVALSGDATIQGSVIIDGQEVQDHALLEAPTCSDSDKLTWSGTAWICKKEDDPSVGTLVSGKWCAESGGQIVCNQEKPSSDLELDTAIGDAVMDNVRDFARKSGSLAACGGGEVLIADGSTLKCISLDTIASGTLILNDLSDVNVGLPAVNDLLYFDGTEWTAGQVVEPFAKAPVDGLTSGRCQVGEIVTFDGDQLVCVADIGGPSDALILEDMADVSGTTTPSATNILTFDGTYWKADTEKDANVSSWAKIATPITNLVSGQCDTGYTLTFDGTQLTCVIDAGGAADPAALSGLSDVSLTTPANNEVLAYVGGQWVNQTETDPTVQDFAKTTNPLPTCTAGNILTSDGTNLSCVADADTAAAGLQFDDLTDVSITTPTNHDLVVYNGSGFVNKGSAVCSAGEVLTYDGTNFSCATVSNLGLWTDNTTYISRGSAHVINDAQALPAALTGAGVRTVWYPQKSAFRAGEVAGTQWDDANIGSHSFAVGNNAEASGANAVAFGGANATASGDNSVAVGLGTTAFDVTAANTMAIIGGNVGIGTVTPATALDVSGSILISNGGETCNASTEGAVRYISSNIEICNGTAWTGISAGSADWFTLTSVPTGVQNVSNTALDVAELQQLQNIDAVTVSNAQWNYLGAMDQSVTTTDDVTFATISTTGNADISGTVKVAGTGAEVCDAAAEGTIRFNPATGRLQYCRP